MKNKHEIPHRSRPVTGLLLCRAGGWITILVVLSGLAGCQAGGTGPAPQQQSSADAFRHRLVAESGGLYKNPEVSLELAEIGKRLSAAAGARPVTILVLNSAIPDAYIAPGEYIYLTRALLALTDDDSEIAAVVAHEMAHILSRHAEARSRLGRQAAISSADIAAALPDSDRVRALLAEGSARVAALSRQQELEADAMAILLLAEAGYDPAALVRFLKTMQATEAAPGARRSYNSSHPLPSDRIERAEKLAANYRPEATEPAGEMTGSAIADSGLDVSKR
ncbi:M48 family metallopeptidase [Martelella soudanensis]|uniref:M48 family metallopeptidase n=1 Tax=unclassified Martelella TaxID=2629616 RepID=UPI0015DFCF5E|nr:MULTISPECIES: M48 family metallopeptidase [unclassified Martelella]